MSFTPQSLILRAKRIFISFLLFFLFFARLSHKTTNRATKRFFFKYHHWKQNKKTVYLRQSGIHSFNFFPKIWTQYRLRRKVGTELIPTIGVAASKPKHIHFKEDKKHHKIILISHKTKNKGNKMKCFLQRAQKKTNSTNNLISSL